MNDQCTLADTDLVAYAAGDLKGARREYVEANVEVCPACRQRVEEYQEIDRLLQDTVRNADVSNQRAAIKARLAVEADRQGSRGTVFRNVRPAAVAAGLLLVALALAFPLRSIWADFQLAHFVNFTDEETQPEIRQAYEGPPGEPIGTLAPSGLDASDLRFEPAVADHLPLGLELIAQTVSNPEKIELRYENRDGLRIGLVERLSTASRSTTVQRPEVELVVVDDTIVVQQATSPRGRVSRMLWERQGVLFDLTVIKSPASAGFDVETAHQVVRMVMEAQDAP